MSSYYTYILYSEKLSKYYIGYTGDLADRLNKHNRSMKGFTSTGKPWKLVYSEMYDCKTDALKREKQLKNWKSPTLIRELIARNGGSEPPNLK